MKKIKTFLPIINTAQWTGGTVFSSNLLYALENYAPEIEIINLPDIKSSKISRYLPGNLKKVLNRLHPFINRQIMKFKRLRRDSNNQPEAIFSLGYYGGNSETATLSWLPDFQHIHLPEMFSSEEISLRNNIFRETAQRTTLVVLSSRNALEDYSSFIPEYAHKGRVMSFAAQIPENIYSYSPDKYLEKYSLPNKFIYLPNQFWRHKNHLFVLETLSILKKENIKPYVICSGNESDYRNPGYFNSLKAMTNHLGLQDRVIFLGLIPRDDVFQLIRQAAFVLNPSLFEGWSTTVEETKSVGKRILLSDLKVHREQNPPNAFFFDPTNSEDLAKKLKTAWLESSPGPDQYMEQKAADLLPQRMKSFADSFVGIVKEAIEKVNKI
jgi:glycosyltransferase involved in cell wall biosynthesis